VVFARKYAIATQEKPWYTLPTVPSTWDTAEERTDTVSDLTIQQAARRLQVTPRAVRNWIKKGHFPNAYKQSPARNSPYRIPETDVAAFDKARRSP